MGKLVFIGVGLYDDSSMTLEALEVASACDLLYAEQYTSMLSPGSIEAIGRRTGRHIELLDRDAVESGAFLKRAKSSRVGLIVPGDPMTATTHVALRIRAHEMKIECEMVHGTSAIVAVPGILGLQHYKFGRIVTIPYPDKGFSPVSPLERLVENLDRGVHTLVLLDIRSHEGRYMTANEGLSWLLETAARVGSDRISPETLACVVARAGSSSCLARANRISALIPMDFGHPLHTIVVTGELHFEEIEALMRFADAPRELFLRPETQRAGRV